MKIFLFISFFLIIILNNNIYSQDSLSISKNNIEIFSGLLSAGLDVIQDELSVLGKEKVYLIKFDRINPGSEFYYQEARKKLSWFKIISSSDIIPDFVVYIENLSFIVKYYKSSNNSFIDMAYNRNLSVVYNYRIFNNSNDSIIFSGTSKKGFSDNISIENLDRVENSSYDFTKGKHPEQGFLQKFFVPALVVTAMLITIVLFYSIRSK